MKHCSKTLCNSVTVAVILLSAVPQPTKAEVEKTPYQKMLSLAQQGYPAGMTAVGKMLCTGDGVLKNEKEGLGWFEAARYILGEDHWSQRTQKELAPYYDGIPSETVEEARKLGESHIATIEEAGIALESPAATTIASLRYIRSFDTEENVSGLALLYKASSRMSGDSPDKEPFVTFNAHWLKQTEDVVGKTGALKAQDYASRMKDITWYNEQGPHGNYLAVLEIIDPEKATTEKTRLARKGGDQRSQWEKIKDELNLVELEPLPIKEKSWFERAGDFFSGSD